MRGFFFCPHTKTHKMQKPKSAWAWLPGLYFIEGLPNAIVGTLSVAYYSSRGMSNADMAMLTSFLYLPWVLKGFWGPLVDSISTKRNWVLFCLGIFLSCFVGLVAAQFFSFWIAATAAIFWILGFASATYDIAADGYYMLALDDRRQSFFVGIRNAFYRLAVLFGQGAMLVIAGKAKTFFEDERIGWAVSFGACVAILLLCIPLFQWTLPKPRSDTPRKDSNVREVWANIKNAFREFLCKKDIVTILLFIFFYRFAEAQLVKITQPFLLDSRANGGLGLTLEKVGTIYGTIGAAALLLGGILGGIFISRRGLIKSLLPMVLALNLTNLVYVYLAAAQPGSAAVIGSLVVLEQFCYGFGFAAFMVYLIQVSKGENKTSSYAICTSLMALGIMIPGFFGGKLQEFFGYLDFFIYVCFATTASFLVTWLAYKQLKRQQNSQ